MSEPSDPPEGFIGPILAPANQEPEVTPVIAPAPEPASKPKRVRTPKPAPPVAFEPSTPTPASVFPGFTIVDF